MLWHLPGKASFCREHSNSLLPHVYMGHSSMFMRPLRNVELYLQENKKINIDLASRRLNGLIVPPGGLFSFWRLVGLPCRLKGYKEGFVLSGGNIRQGVGGGLCQLSNLLYWMTLHTPLQVVERWRHSYDVFPDVNRTLPFGSGATVSYNYVDLQILNPTSRIFQLNLWQDQERLHGEWRSDQEPEETYRVIERNHRLESRPWGHTRHNELYRTVTSLTSGHSREEFITANNAVMMYNPFLEDGKNA
ncbi:vancomycin resistance protein [Deltaproteobacteria bacterium Smac51]|nr:vancomycin resistance protein [Deltaproteobacteria bacterium Smac51]